VERAVPDEFCVNLVDNRLQHLYDKSKKKAELTLTVDAKLKEPNMLDVSTPAMAAAAPHTFPNLTKVPGYRAWATRCGALWEYAPKTNIWRRCIESLANEDGRWQVSLTPDHGTRRVQRRRTHVVFITFYGAVPVGLRVDHKDNNPSNDHADNLQLLTDSENTIKGHRETGGYAGQKCAVRAVNRAGEFLTFESRKACGRHFGVSDKAVLFASLRGTFARRNHSPFKDWIVTAI
jgi:hypothetical protein